MIPSDTPLLLLKDLIHETRQHFEHGNTPHHKSDVYNWSLTNDTMFPGQHQAFSLVEQICLTPDTKNSLNKRRSTNHNGINSKSTNMKNMTRINILSAIGSRKVPKTDINFFFLAIKPSNKWLRASLKLLFLVLLYFYSLIFFTTFWLK